MAKLAEAWRPWRGVAAHLLWAYYHVVKRRDGAPVSRRSPKCQQSEKKSGNEWRELDGPRLEPRSRRGTRSSSCSCTAMAPTATT